MIQPLIILRIDEEQENQIVFIQFQNDELKIHLF